MPTVAFVFGSYVRCHMVREFLLMQVGTRPDSIQRDQVASLRRAGNPIEAASALKSTGGLARSDAMKRFMRALGWCAGLFRR